MYTAHVGKYPKSIGPSPLYIPLTPSCVHMVLAVPINPLYIALVGASGRIILRKEPCACSLVFMTSKGQVTMPDAIPAKAPHKPLTVPSESLEQYTAKFDMGCATAACCRAVPDTPRPDMVALDPLPMSCLSATSNRAHLQYFWKWMVPFR